MDRWPSGIVAFLMTDVEGSSRAWNDSTTTMDAAVGRLDADVGAIVAARGGVVVKARGEGDSHFAAFVSASQAVDAAAALQRRPDDRLSLRGCVIVGEAEPRHDDYLGPVVNHGARVRSVAHGGQVVVTRGVVDIVAGHLDPGLDFRALGAHRLRDVPEPIELFQLCGPGLRASFPPLQTAAFAASAMMAVVVVDEVGASRRRHQSDDQMIAWQRELIQALRERADGYDGRYLKFVGDGCLVAFEDPRAAVAFADGVPVSCRVGVAVGVVEVVEGELAGRPVFEATELMRAAGPGEVRCCDVTSAVCSPRS